MLGNELMQAQRGGKIEKKTYCHLIREKLKVLKELQAMLEENGMGQKLEISEDDIWVVSDELKIPFDFSQTFCRAESVVAFQGDYEQAEMNFLSSMLVPNANIFDIGANAGIFALNMVKLGNCPHVYAFEPLPATYRKMEHTLAINSNIAERGKIECFNMGFADKRGTAVFYLPGEDEAASMKPIDDEFYLQESNERGCYTGAKKQVEVNCSIDTVDNFIVVHGLQELHLLKCDVEGAERDVLLGAHDTLVNFRPMVYCELLRKHAKRFGYHPNVVIDYMASLGYACFTYQESKLCELREMTEDTKETNFIFLHREKHGDIIKGNE